MSSKQSDGKSYSQSSFIRQTQVVSDLFSIPAPVKRLFDLVPLVTYPPDNLPQRSPEPSRLPVLYVFSRESDTAVGRPSYNPSCLKWQTFLHIAGIDHRLAASNNHASPNGILPFLMPSQAANPSVDISRPVASNQLMRYAMERGYRPPESFSIRYEAYQSLLDHRIRNAWLYTLYLEPRNFDAVAHGLYITPTSANPLVQASIAQALRSAAEAELIKYTTVIDADDLYSEADKAFEALSILLGEDKWFLGNDKPSLFDASVFAYTNLLLDDGLGWREKKLCRALRRRENLVQHRERLLVKYFSD